MCNADAQWPGKIVEGDTEAKTWNFVGTNLTLKIDI